MSDCDVTAMEGWMTQPMPVCCEECDWCGFDINLEKEEKEEYKKCPICGSSKIKIDR